MRRFSFLLVVTALAAQDQPFNLVGETLVIRGAPHSDSGSWYEFAPDLKHHYAVERDGKGYVVTIDKVRGHPYEKVFRPVMSASGKVAYVASVSGESFVVIGEARERTYALVKDLTLSPTGRYAYRGILDGETLIVDGEPAAKTEGHIDGIWWNPTGTRLVWAVTEAKSCALIEGSERTELKASPRLVAFSSDGKRLAVLALKSETLGLYIDGAEAMTSNQLNCFVWSPNSVRWCATTVDKDLATFYIGNKDNPAKFRGRAGTFTFSADGQHFAYVAMIDGKETIVIDEKPQGEFLQPRRLRFSPDGKLVAFVEKDQRIRAGQFSTELFSDILWFDWSPDSEHLISVVKDRDKFRVLIDAQLEPGFDEIHTPVFSQDGRKVAYTAFNGSDVKLVVRTLKKR